MNKDDLFSADFAASFTPLGSTPLGNAKAGLLEASVAELAQVDRELRRLLKQRHALAKTVRELCDEQGHELDEMGSCVRCGYEPDPPDWDDAIDRMAGL